MAVGKLDLPGSVGRVFRGKGVRKRQPFFELLQRSSQVALCLQYAADPLMDI